jgi:hypothetical protein
MNIIFCILTNGDDLYRYKMSVQQTTITNNYFLPADVIRSLIEYLPLHAYHIYRDVSILSAIDPFTSDIGLTLGGYVIDAIVRNDIEYCRDAVNRSPWINTTSQDVSILNEKAILTSQDITTIVDKYDHDQLSGHWTIAITHGRIVILDILGIAGKRTFSNGKDNYMPYPGWAMCCSLELAPDTQTLECIWNQISSSLSGSVIIEMVDDMIYNCRLSLLRWLAGKKIGGLENCLYFVVWTPAYGDRTKALRVIRSNPEMLEIFVNASLHDEKLVQRLLRD